MYVCRMFNHQCFVQVIDEHFLKKRWKRVGGAPPQAMKLEEYDCVGVQLEHSSGDGWKLEIVGKKKVQCLLYQYS